MGQLTREFNEFVSMLSRRAKAPQQAGIFVGLNPATYNINDPFPLWVIQIIIIMAMVQLLSFFLSRIRQPRVIAEVIGGVLLGPSVMGRIPNYMNTIWPTQSFVLLNLTSTIGLVFFLFMVGMEIDINIIRKNYRTSMAISAVGLVIPLGLGAALGIPIYHQFVDSSVKFGYFLLFVAVAIGITAFPVLCRILTELQLLDDTVGAVTLAAGVGNDVVGWILLALTVALVNASTGLTALWVLLTGAGYVIFTLLPIRWAYRWAARRTGCLDNGAPNAMMMAITYILVLFSAFFTDIIGIHPIFGGFLAGLVIPRDNGYGIALVEKFEDFVSLLLLPLYFALSGLKTNLGLLDNGITWGYTVLICVIAFFSKFLGCASVAYFCGFTWRESGAIGSLMSCKGLVELIVLNVGLSAGILDTRTFSMFVLHALVLTFMTTPLTLMFYPARFRTKALAPRSKSGEHLEASTGAVSNEAFKTYFTVVLERVEQLPAAMTLTQLLKPVPSPSPAKVPSSDDKSSPADDEKGLESPPGLSYTPSQISSRIHLDAFRIIELTDRTSAVLKSHSVETLVRTDPVLSVFRTFGYLNRMAVSLALAVISYDEFPAHIANHVREVGSDMLILPWNATPSADVAGQVQGDAQGTSNTVTNPFEGLFGLRAAASSGSLVLQTQFFRKMFLESVVDTALFVDRGVPHISDGQDAQHIFLPFFGGPDDRLALSFVVQLCLNSSTSATIVRFTKVDSDELTPVNSIVDTKSFDHAHVAVTFPDTVYAQRDTQTQLASDTADNLLWQRYLSGSVPEVTDALERIKFSQEMTSRPLHSMLEVAGRTLAGPARPMVVVGRSRRLAVETHSAELKQLVTEHGVTMDVDLVKALGDLAAGFVVVNANTNLLVMQAAH